MILTLVPRTKPRPTTVTVPPMGTSALPGITSSMPTLGVTSTEPAVNKTGYTAPDASVNRSAATSMFSGMVVPAGTVAGTRAATVSSG